MPITSAISNTIQALDDFMQTPSALLATEASAKLMADTVERGGRIYACDTGGSLSKAVHFAESLTARLKSEHARGTPPLISDVGHLTCAANDYGYDQVFAHFLERHGRAGDCLFAMSATGEGPNVIDAAQCAKRKGLSVISLTNARDSPLERLSSLSIVAPGDVSAHRAEELQVIVIHVLLDLVETQVRSREA